MPDRRSAAQPQDILGHLHAAGGPIGASSDSPEGHDLRHTHATLALRAGIHPRVVQERLGHANVGITLDTYSHVDLDMQAAAAARVVALLVDQEVR
ncbi:MAG: tyrosine-type recombinase/integrase [Nocardioidaceae bacterium]